MTSLPDSNCFSEPFSCAAIHKNCTNSIVVQVLNDGTRFALILYFRMVAHTAAFYTRSNAFRYLARHGTDSADVSGTFHTGF